MEISQNNFLFIFKKGNKKSAPTYIYLRVQDNGSRTPPPPKLYSLPARLHGVKPGRPQSKHDMCLVRVALQSETLTTDHTTLLMTWQYSSLCTHGWRQRISQYTEHSMCGKSTRKSCELSCWYWLVKDTNRQVMEGRSLLSTGHTGRPHMLRATTNIYCYGTWTYAPLYTVTQRGFQPRSQNCEKRLLASSCLSFCPHRTSRLPLDRFLWKSGMSFFENLSRKF
jgi:hypothetical protein